MTSIPPPPPSDKAIPCRTCGHGLMRTCRVARFNGCLQAMGIVVALVGAVILLFGSVIFGAASNAKPIPNASPVSVADRPGETPTQKLQRMQEQQAREDKLNRDIHTAVTGTVGAGGLVAGAFGFILLFGGGSLLFRKRVWRCQNCGAFIDRL